MRIIKNEKGSALLIAMAMSLMLFLVGVAAVNNSVTDTDMSFNQSYTEQAFYVAEAGAWRAFTKIKADSTWNTGFTDESFGGGTYSVIRTDSSTNPALLDTVVITSTGEADGCRAIVELTLAPDIFHPFKHAMFADKSMDIRNSFNTDSYCSDSGTYAATVLTSEGDVGSNGTIDVANGAFIGGDVASSLTGGTNVHWGATVTGTTTDAAEAQEVPAVPASEFTAAQANNSAPAGLSGSYSYNVATNTFLSTGNVVLASGTYFFSSMILKNSASLSVAPGAEVKIYITGDIEMKNSSEMNSGGTPGSLQIYSQGDFVLKNSGDVAAVFYSPNGDADLRNSGQFFGSIIAEDIVAHNSALFHYDRTLANIESGGGGDVEPIGYRQL
ncbi:MAG: hypothetical protein DRP45_05525 [Candidatus Zixiibacteriota bacterium]|nr:MAG: hypothetical protein DRP45_05525 [candidate division Zixibacteria bacterium]